jgi:hypothetical protein
MLMGRVTERDVDTPVPVIANALACLRCQPSRLLAPRRR